jgi:hypothetical protein
MTINRYPGRESLISSRPRYLESARTVNAPPGQVSYPSLHLVTFGGPFEPATGQYLDSIAGYAYLASRAR